MEGQNMRTWLKHPDSLFHSVSIGQAQITVQQVQDSFSFEYNNCYDFRFSNDLFAGVPARCAAHASWIPGNLACTDKISDIKQEVSLQAGFSKQTLHKQ